MHELQEKFFDRQIKSDDLRNDSLLSGTLQCGVSFEGSVTHGVDHDHQQQ